MNGQSLTESDRNKIVAYTAQGKTLREITELTGLSESSVTRTRRNPEYKVKIEQIQKGYADKTIDQIIEIEQAVLDTTQDFVQGKPNKDGERIKGASPEAYQGASVLMGFFYKFGKGVKLGLGILPAPTQTPFVQNVYNDNRSPRPRLLIHHESSTLNP